MPPGDYDSFAMSLDTFYSSRREPTDAEEEVVHVEKKKEKGFIVGSEEFTLDRPPQMGRRRNSNNADPLETTTTTPHLTAAAASTAIPPRPALEQESGLTTLDTPPKPPSKRGSFSGDDNPTTATGGGDSIPRRPPQRSQSAHESSPLPPAPALQRNHSSDDTSTAAASLGANTIQSTASSRKSIAYRRLLQNRRRPFQKTAVVVHRKKSFLPGVSPKVQALMDLASTVVNSNSLPDATKLYQRCMDTLAKEIKDMNQDMMQKSHVATDNSSEQQPTEWKKRYHRDLERVGIVIGLLRTKMALLNCGEEHYDTAIAFCTGTVQVHEHQPTFRSPARQQEDELAGLMGLIVERMEKARTCLRHHVELLNKIDMYSSQDDQQSVDEDDHSVFSTKEIVFEMIAHSAQQDDATVELLLHDNDDILDLLSVHASEQDKHEQALKFLNDSLQIHLVALGLKHPEAGTSLLRIAKMYRGGVGNDRANEQCVLGYFHRTASVLKRSNLGARERGSVLNDIAVIHMRRGDYNEAIKFLLDALHTYDEDAAEIEKAGRTAAALQVWRNLGECYMQLRKYRSAEGAYLKAMDIQDQSRKIQDTAESLDLEIVGIDEPLQTIISDTSIADTICRIGKARASGGDHEKALDLYKKALGLLHASSCDDDYLSEKELLAKRDQLTHIFSCMADACGAVGNPEKGFAMYKLSMKLRNANGADKVDKRSSTLEHCLLCLIGMGDLYSKLNEYDNAIKSFREALEYAASNKMDNDAFLVSEARRRLENTMTAFELAPDKRSLVRKLERQADTEIENGTLDKATETLKKLLAIRRATLKSMKSKGYDISEQIYSLGCLLQTFGYVFAKNGDDENAEIAFKDASRLFRKGPLVEETLVAL